MRRLFSTFAPGSPAIGLLLLRFACATILIGHAIDYLRGTLQFPELLLQVSTIGLSLLLIVGLWTPIAATLAVFDALLIGFSHPASARYWLVAVVCFSITLLGPGAWSIDAKLFGWKRIKIDDEDN
jgi:uncharacterized membrane protein YphA (DoxX/SURF4 family)